MNSTKKRIHMPRAILVAGLVAAVAAPSAAMAKPLGWDNVAQRYENSAQGQDTHSHASKPYVLPSSFHSEATTPRVPVKQPYTLPSTFHSEARDSAPVSTTTSSQPNVIVREIHTVTQDDNHTLALVLASCALGIALCGTGYALVRLSVIQRRSPASS
jgi:hypothetical protein